MLSVDEVAELRDKVQEVAELADGIKSLMEEEGYSGYNGLWNICKQLYELSADLTEKIQAEEQKEGIKG